MFALQQKDNDSKHKHYQVETAANKSNTQQCI